SVDLIFTDPPFDKDSLPLYGDVAGLAARVLKPGGSLVCYAPTCYVGRALDLLRRPGLTFGLPLVVRQVGKYNRLNGLRVWVNAKYLLWLTKGPYRGEWLMNLIDSAPPSKEAHEWAQSEVEAAYCVERMCPPGGLVLDPLCGSGTTLAAALRLGRRALGCEIDPRAAKVAAARLRDMRGREAGATPAG